MKKERSKQGQTNKQSKATQHTHMHIVPGSPSLCNYCPYDLWTETQTKTHTRLSLQVSSKVIQ